MQKACRHSCKISVWDLLMNFLATLIKKIHIERTFVWRSMTRIQLARPMIFW